MVRAKVGARSALEWYQESERWYVVGHQGCPWCHAQHCVIRSDWSGLIEYYCSICDFSACHDSTRGEEFIATGGRLPEAGLALPSAVLPADRGSKATATPVSR